MTTKLIKALNIPTGIWTADLTHSELSFTVRHAGISKVRGKFADFSAIVKIDENSVSSITADINTDSFTTGNEGRDNHVKSADFFEVDKFPKMTFISNHVKTEDEELILSGELTIKDVTKTVDLKVELNGVERDPFGLLRAGLEATTVISRKDFGLTWNAVLESGNLLISDKVTIELDLSFILEENSVTE